MRTVLVSLAALLLTAALGLFGCADETVYDWQRPHGIIKSYGGAVLVSSTPGRGSLFEVYLPLLPRRDVQDLS